MIDILDRLRDMPDEQFRNSLKEKLMQAVLSPAPSHLPEGFRTITPYLIVSNASDLLDFLKATFGASEKMRVARPDGKLMHAEVVIDDSVVEMSDGSEQYPPSAAAVHVYVPDVDATYSRAMAAGASSLFTPADQPFGDRGAGISDPWGNNWYLATHLLRPGNYMPEGMHAVNPFLHPQKADGQIRFLVEGLGGTELGRHEMEGRIAYARVAIGSGVVELSEARERSKPMPASIHVHVEDCDAVYQRALAAGGTNIYAVADQPYGERSGGVLDPYGNRWWIATRIETTPK